MHMSALGVRGREVYSFLKHDAVAVLRVRQIARKGAVPNSHPAVTSIGLGSNFKYLPDVDWVESAPAKERGSECLFVS